MSTEEQNDLLRAQLKKLRDLAEAAEKLAWTLRNEFASPENPDRFSPQRFLASENWVAASRARRLAWDVWFTAAYPEADPVALFPWFTVEPGQSLIPCDEEHTEGRVYARSEALKGGRE